jgi:hypothetical protein
MEKKKTRVLIEPISDLAKDRFETLMCMLHTCKIDHETNEQLFLSSVNENYRFVVQKQNDSHWKIVK